MHGLGVDHDACGRRSAGGIRQNGVGSGRNHDLASAHRAVERVHAGTVSALLFGRDARGVRKALVVCRSNDGVRLERVRAGQRGCDPRHQIRDAPLGLRAAHREEDERERHHHYEQSKSEEH